MAINFRKSKVFKNKSYSQNKKINSKPLFWGFNFLNKNQNNQSNYSLKPKSIFSFGSIFNNFNNSSSSKKSTNKNLKSSTHVIRSKNLFQNNSKNLVNKVFEPVRDITEEINKSGKSSKKSEKSFIPRINGDKFKNLGNFSPKRTLYAINYFITKHKLVYRFNWLSFGITGFCLIAFIIYLLFFDTFFLIKNYSVTFDGSSYLSVEDSKQVIDSIKKDKFLGFVPNNQLWFANSKNMTIAANKNVSEVKNIIIEDRVWPNSINIRVVTQPILLTLVINNNEYWRVGRSGDVLSRDDAGLRENLVVVERPISFSKPNVSLSDYKFDKNCPKDTDKVINNAEQCDQLNRFWFTVWIWQQLDNLEIKYNKTIYPSLFDTDVFVQTDSGTTLRFNSINMSSTIQSQRITNILKSDIMTRVNQGGISYIDFRIPKKVYLCNRGGQCERSLAGLN
jgi:hypothetical protein